MVEETIHLQMLTNNHLETENCIDFVVCRTWIRLKLDLLVIIRQSIFLKMAVLYVLKQSDLFFSLGWSVQIVGYKFKNMTHKKEQNILDH
jgi:hypothetical protein